jgi:hypothetical protein
LELQVEGSEDAVIRTQCSNKENKDRDASSVESVESFDFPSKEVKLDIIRTTTSASPTPAEAHPAEFIETGDKDPA